MKGQWPVRLALLLLAILCAVSYRLAFRSLNHFREATWLHVAATFFEVGIALFVGTIYLGRREWTKARSTLRGVVYPAIEDLRDALTADAYSAFGSSTAFEARARRFGRNHRESDVHGDDERKVWFEAIWRNRVFYVKYAQEAEAELNRFISIAKPFFDSEDDLHAEESRKRIRVAGETLTKLLAPSATEHHQPETFSAILEILFYITWARTWLRTNVLASPLIYRLVSYLYRRTTGEAPEPQDAPLPRKDEVASESGQDATGR